jgi:tRNA threonylcarbamoyl adenosine modification protein YeaZ
MIILFIDTHDSLITIALKNNDKLYVKTKESEYSHSIFTMPMIKELFEENSLNISDLKKIIVINGPGSFTGIRIGVSIAKTIAYALNICINTISSLTAYLISSNLNENKMCIIEDNKGYYVSAFDKDNKVIISEEYVEELNSKYTIIENKLKIDKIIEFCENMPCEEVHKVKARYVKKIEVEK